MSELREAVHRNPAWRERADFIVGIEIDPVDTNVLTEQLWVRKIPEVGYEICCIPFFAYDLSLGDVVTVDDGFLVTDVVSRSGRYVFRVHFEKSNRENSTAVEINIGELGGMVEWSSPSLLAVDAPDQTTAQSIADYLEEQEHRGALVYETGNTA